VQDLAATLPARVLAARPGERVLDLCAAPGGKTAQLASAGADVTSVERDPGRASRLEANLQRLRLQARVVIASVSTYVPESLYTAVLLDAPCTATGTFRRHPDIMWTKGFADIATTARRQLQLLDKSAAVVAPGGRLVYAVCSMEPEEGPQVVESFLAANPDFYRLPIRPDETGFACTEAGDLRTHPALMADDGGLDGFYIARLGRAA
jgi:16S rRNA (cytosine967-C5)-methyltransferase